MTTKDKTSKYDFRIEVLNSETPGIRVIGNPSLPVDTNLTRGLKPAIVSYEDPRKYTGPRFYSVTFK